MMKRDLFVIILLSLIPIVGNAQALQFLKADVDPMTSAMGGVTSVYGNSAYSAFNNAALLPFNEQKLDVAIGYYDIQPKGTRVRGMNVGGAYCVNDALGFSFAFSGGRGNPYESIDAEGNFNGRFSPSEYLVSIGAAYGFGQIVSVGLNVGYAMNELSQGVFYNALVSDLFAMAELYGIRLTAGVSDFGTFVRSVSGTSYSLPSSVVVGIGYTFDMWEEHVLKIAAEGNLWKEKKVSASLGASYRYADFLEVRAGYRYGGRTFIPSSFSVGLGLRFAGFGLDFSYLPPVVKNRLSETWSVGLLFSIDKDDQ